MDGKTHPLIFDTLVNDMPAAIEGASRIRPLLFQTRHFVLDSDACQFLTRLASEDGLLAELREFAIPPFDKLAISHRYGKEHVGYPTATFGTDPAEFQSLTLWDHGEWKLFVAAADGSSLAAVPGWTYNLPHGAVANDKALERGDAEKVLGSLALHRTLIDAFFLILARPGSYQVNFNEARRTLRKGKPVKFFARSEIKIDLTDVKTFRRGFYTGARAPSRRHEVRRHFTHFGGDRAHSHAWEPLDSEDGRKRWLCSCGRRRVERGPFGRGDANRGYVHQHYAITASND